MFLTRKRNRRSNVNLSHVKATTLAPGNLVPISFTRILTGDYLSFDPSSFVQAFPMNAPLVNGFKLCLEYFFIPDRIYNVDANMDFPGVANNPDDVKFPLLSAGRSSKLSSDGKVLTLTSSDSAYSSFAKEIVSPGSLADYCGFPVGWFSTVKSGGSLENNFSMLKAAGYIDTVLEYYVAPQIERVSTAAFLSASNSVGDYNASYPLDQLQKFMRMIKTTSPVDGNTWIAAVNSQLNYSGLPKFGSWWWYASRFSIFQRCLPPYYLESWMSTSNYSDSEITVDLEAGDKSVSFRNISVASHIQRWMDLAGAGSGRYSDYLEGQFDVSRIKNCHVPLFLGADRQYLGSKVIYQTTGAGNADSPLGAFAGQASGGDKFRHRSYKFGENGFFMVMASLVPDVVYSRGIDPFLKELSLGDVYTPALDNLAMEPLMVDELDAAPSVTSMSFDSDLNNATFNFSHLIGDIKNVAVGYVPAWSRLMQNVSRSHGRLTTSLSYWLLNRDYGYRFQRNTAENMELVALRTYVGNLPPSGDSGMSADLKEAFFAFLDRALQSGTAVYSPYIQSNQYNNVFADVSNSAQNFVLTFSCSMRANREKGKVNVSTTL
nr:MAG TPA: Major capsid protein [Microviridae sp.]